MADLSTPELGKLVERLGPEAGIDAVGLDMIRRGDMLGSELGAKVYDALSRIAAERDEARGALGAVSAAIGSVRWMDPPDGGDVTLAEQVRRMRADLEAAERERVELKAEVERLREALTGMVQRFELYAGPNDINAGHHDLALLKTARAALRTPEESP